MCFFMGNNLAKKYISFILTIILMYSLVSCSKYSDQIENSNLTESSASKTSDESELASFNRLEKEIKSINESIKYDAGDSSTDIYNYQRPEIQGSKFRFLNDYFVNSDLSNVANWFQFGFSDEEKEKIAKNGFIAELTKNQNFAERYIKNNSLQLPNYITVDSLTYIYNIYISYLKAKLESEYLSQLLLRLTHEMLDESKIIYEKLKGSTWEEAAKRNVLFFTVALSLQEDCIPEEYIESEFQIEQALIEEGSKSAPSSLTLVPRDYSLFKPVGHYLWSDTLSKYYRTLTWYQNMALPQDREDFIRSAFLLSLAEENIASNYYDTIISLSSFLYGIKDDITCFDYKKIIKEIYEEIQKEDEGDEIIPKDLVIKEILNNNKIDSLEINISDYASLVENDEIWKEFTMRIKDIDVRKHRFVSYDYFNQDKAFGNSEVEQGLNTFSFIPNAYSLDDYIFNLLIKDAVVGREATNMLDLAAVFGSEDAENILNFSNEGLYGGYFAILYTLRKELYEVSEDGVLGLHKRISTQSEASEKIGFTKESYDEFIDSGGVASENVDYYFLKAIRALLYDKSPLAPKFMNSNLWRLKVLESFCGAYTQFENSFDINLEEKTKSEDILPKYLVNDDDGFVEVEPHVFKRLLDLSFIIKNGLEKFNLLDKVEEENLNRLMNLSDTLYECAKKEEEGVYLSQAEFEVIRNYGDEILYFEENLKRFIILEKNINVDDEKYELTIGTNVGQLLSSSDSKQIMQTSLGPASDIYVATLINGELKIAVGTMYSFYQFKIEKENKISTKKWNEIIEGAEDFKNLNYEIATPSNMIDKNVVISKPDWTKDYTYNK